MMTTTNPTPVAEYRDVDEQRFRSEILGSYRPAVLRGFVKHWPALKLAASPEDMCRYLLACDNGHPVDALLAAVSEKGRLFYQDDMAGFNFARRKLPVSAVIEQLARYSQFEHPPSVAVQSAPIDDCLPRFAQENVVPFLDPAVRPRIWLGNTITTPAHFDESNNIACVVAGKRRFTLFPPGQVGNLYIGPLDFAPTPTPISMVDFSAPTLRVFRVFAMPWRRPRWPSWSRATRCISRRCGGTTCSRTGCSMSWSTTGGRRPGM